jgi:hypothetical protein
VNIEIIHRLTISDAERLHWQLLQLPQSQRTELGYDPAFMVELGKAIGSSQYNESKLVETLRPILNADHASWDTAGKEEKDHWLKENREPARESIRERKLAAKLLEALDSNDVIERVLQSSAGRHLASSMRPASNRQLSETASASELAGGRASASGQAASRPALDLLGQQPAPASASASNNLLASSCLQASRAKFMLVRLLAFVLGMLLAASLVGLLLWAIGHGLIQ